MSLESVSDALNLPKDVVLGATVLHVIGQYEIYIENYKNIIDFNDSQIKVKTRNSTLIIIGKNLHIEYFNHEDMKIKGRIQDIHFQM